MAEKSGPKPGMNEAARLRRRVQVADLYCQGLTQFEIAGRLGISQVQASRDLDWIRKRWPAQALRDRGQLVAEALAEIDHIQREAWDTWERSHQPREQQAAGRKTTGAAGGKSATAEEETGAHRYGRDGNVAYLNVVLACVERRAKLLGLDALPKVDAEAEIRQWAVANGYDPDEAMRNAKRGASGSARRRRRCRSPSRSRPVTWSSTPARRAETL